MSFLQPWLLFLMPLVLLPVIIHLINQWRHQTRPWAAMMFLLEASRMDRGHARLKRWLILTLRTLIVAALLLAVARPLSRNLFGWSLGEKVDTTIVLLDRSPSMQQAGASGQSKRQQGLLRLAETLPTIGSAHWVLIDSATEQPETFTDVRSLVESPRTRESSTVADVASMLEAAATYIRENNSGSTEVWICSDLRQADWNAADGKWAAVREAFTSMSQTVRFHLLSYPQAPDLNVSIHVTDVRRVAGDEGDAVLLSLQLSAVGEAIPTGDFPIEIEIEGARTQLNVDFTDQQLELVDYRVPIAANVRRGWGRVMIPADANAADNEAYFVFEETPPRQIVIVSDDLDLIRPAELAATISPDAVTLNNVQVVSPTSLSTAILVDAALLIWQSELPSERSGQIIQQYLTDGGQAIFFPPSSLPTLRSASSENRFLGVRWERWVDAPEQRMVGTWQTDEGLLAATRSGSGLPLSGLQINGHAVLSGEVSNLATLSGGDPLLARPTSQSGGVYFCSALPTHQHSTLADNGIVLYAMIQRAIADGAASMGQTSLKIAGQAKQLGNGSWQQVAGHSEWLSSEFGWHAGVFAAGSELTQQLVAINQSVIEDNPETLGEADVDQLFAGLPYSYIEDSVDSGSGIVREIWRAFLLFVIVIMLVEAMLCLPRTQAAANASTDAASTVRLPQRRGEAA